MTTRALTAARRPRADLSLWLDHEIEGNSARAGFKIRAKRPRCC
jgi:hypothetical protein